MYVCVYVRGGPVVRRAKASRCSVAGSGTGSIYRLIIPPAQAGVQTSAL